MPAIPRSATTASAVLICFLLAACSRNDRTGEVIDTATGTVFPQVRADDFDDRVEDALDADSSLRQFRLDASDDGNTIVLRGAVRTDDQRALAEQIATRVASGLTIDNRITVSPEAPMRGPDDLEDRVEDALEADSVLAPFDLDVDDTDAGLTITGRVRSDDQKARAEDIAKRIAPGAAIVNRVRVEP